MKRTTEILARCALKSAHAADGRGARGAHTEAVNALVRGGTSYVLAAKCAAAMVAVGHAITHAARRQA